jgi:hypothetical protein
VIGHCHARDRAIEFRKCLDRIDAAVTPDLDVHFILDNYATHQTPLIRRSFARHPSEHPVLARGDSRIHRAEQHYT